MKFKRVYSLEIGKPITNDISLAVDTPFNAVRYNTNHGESIFITDLQVVFKTDRANTSTPNTTEISIYNLSPDNYEFISTTNRIQGSNLLVELVAGYEDDTGVIITGSINKVESVIEGENHITRLTILDGYLNYREALSNISIYPPSDVPRELNQPALDQLIKDLGLPVGIVVPFGDDQRNFGSGWFHNGSTIAGLERLAIETDYMFSIQNGKVFFMPEVQDVLITAHVINKDSGLIGTPTPTESTINAGTKQVGKPKSGIEFKLLMYPTLNIGDIVRMETNKYTGLYKIEKLRHTGDYRGQSWLTECTASEIISKKEVSA